MKTVRPECVDAKAERETLCSLPVVVSQNSDVTGNLLIQKPGNQEKLAEKNR
ncbi:MAG: hypothetical protein ACREH8_01895 [Opitutaceae bacterium]